MYATLAESYYKLKKRIGKKKGSKVSYVFYET